MWQNSSLKSPLKPYIKRKLVGCHFPMLLLLNPNFTIFIKLLSLSLSLSLILFYIVLLVAGSVPSVEFQSCSGLSETSFMSEQAIFYLGSIGLLGEYCPWSRKKNRHFSGQVDCMHLIPLKEERFDFSGCWKAQPSPDAICICAAEEYS